MPDGDKYHSKLSWHYQEAYREICERKSDRSEIVWTLTKALLGNIKKNYGDQPVKYAKQLGAMLQRGIENSGNNSSVDWATLSREIDRQVQQAKLKSYEKGLLLRAGKGILQEFRYHRRIDTSNLPEVIVRQLFVEIYKSNFEERIPLTSDHYAGLDRITVMECIEAINPDILAQIGKWAKKATLDEDVKKLQRSRRQKVKEIDLEENLL